MPKKTTFRCRRCMVEKPLKCNFGFCGGTGYGLRGKRKICYDCCALYDRDDMIRNGEIALYFSHSKRAASNWPGTLVFNLTGVSKGRHNIAGTRYDFWFNGPDGKMWHGVKYGEWTDLARCKRLAS